MYNTLLSRIDRLGPQYAVLHGAGALQKGLSSDLDLVVARKDVPDVLVDLMKAEEFCLVQCLEYEAKCYGLILGIQSPSSNGSYLVVDICSDYRWGGLVIFPEQELLTGRIRKGDFYVVPPKTELSFLLVKKIYEKSTIPLHQRDRISLLVELLGSEADSCVTGVFGNHVGRLLISWIREKRWDVIESNTRQLRWALRWCKLVGDPANPTRYWRDEIIRQVRRIMYPTGLQIAFLGPDGSGKSTLAGQVLVRLRGAFRRASTFHFRPKLLPKRIKSEEFASPHGHPPYSAARSLMMMLYHCADFVLGHFLKVWPRLIRSTLVVFDRYYDDVLADPLRHRLRVPAWIVGACGKVVAKPDVVFVLEGPSFMLWQRKREVSPETLHDQGLRYRDIASRYRCSFLVDAILKPEQLAVQIQRLCWDFLQHRTAHRLYRLTSFHLGRQNLSWIAQILGGEIRSVTSSPVPDRNIEKRPEQCNETEIDFEYFEADQQRSFLLQKGSFRTVRSAMEIYNAQTFVAKLFRAAVRWFPAWYLPRRTTVRLVLPSGYAKRQNPCNLIEEIEAVLREKHVTVAISLGTPGLHRKPVLRVMASDGRPLAYIKVGWNARTASLVESEYLALRSLHALAPRTFMLPEVLRRHSWNGLELLFLSASPSRLCYDGTTLKPMHISILQELASIERAMIKLGDSQYWRDLCARSSVIEHPYWRHAIAGLFSDIEQRLGNVPIPMHRRHGDFTPWNLVCQGDRMMLFDWEYSLAESPAGWDFFHFISQTALHLRKANPLRYFDQIDRRHPELIRQMTCALGVSNRTFFTLFFVYLTERLLQVVSEKPTQVHKCAAIMHALNLLRSRV